jgi:hypothetical protein
MKGFLLAGDNGCGGVMVLYALDACSEVKFERVEWRTLGMTTRHRGEHHRSAYVFMHGALDGERRLVRQAKAAAAWIEGHDGGRGRGPRRGRGRRHRRDSGRLGHGRGILLTMWARPVVRRRVPFVAASRVAGMTVREY